MGFDILNKLSKVTKFTRTTASKWFPQQTQQSYRSNPDLTTREVHMDLGIFEVVNVMQDSKECLTEAIWRDSFDADGRVKNVQQVKRLIHEGKIDKEIRHEVWKFLLEYHEWDSTEEERKIKEAKCNEIYTLLKQKCESLKTDSLFQEKSHRIEKDVNRTDRHLSFFEATSKQHEDDVLDDNSNLRLMRDMLIAYSYYDEHVGYCQGMSDLISPILWVINEECCTFWCFVNLMKKMVNILY